MSQKPEPYDPSEPFNAGELLDGFELVDERGRTFAADQPRSPYPEDNGVCIDCTH